MPFFLDIYTQIWTKWLKNTWSISSYNNMYLQYIHCTSSTYSWTWSPFLRTSAVVTWWSTYPPASCTDSTGYKTSWTGKEHRLLVLPTSLSFTILPQFVCRTDLQSFPDEVAMVMWLASLLRVETGAVQQHPAALPPPHLRHQSLPTVQRLHGCWAWMEDCGTGKRVPLALQCR